MQQDTLMISVSGVRGILGRGLTPEVAVAFAGALGTHVNGGRVVLGRDGRPSGTVLRHAVLSGLLAAGCDVYDLGVAATPTLGVAVRQLQAAGGLEITASHNPAPWNGLKLFGHDGRVLPAAVGERVKALYDARTFRRAAWNELGTLRSCSEADAWHCGRVLACIDAPRIQDRGLRAFLDANGGAGGPLGQRLLQALHCDPVCQGGGADGVFLHEPEPVAENLRDVCPLVRQHGADVGFVLDPDADRLALIDETGRYVGEELTLALAVSFRLRQERGPIVINMSTSRVNEDIARRFNCPCHRAAVGEANVVEMMQAVGAVLGGEGNGGVIDPRVGHVRDPFIGMGLVLSLMAETGQKLSELVDALPTYHIRKDKYAIDRAKLPALLTALEVRWPEAIANRLDGLRLEWPDRWVHVRPSNTEPIVRVIAEAPESAAAASLCLEVGQLLQ